MAHAISITDGTTTVSLNLTSGNMIQSYAMDTADNINDPKITETIDIWFVASSGPNLQAAINAVEALLTAAAQRQEKPNAFPKIFLQMQVDGESNTWRAEIVEGKLKPSEEVLKLWFNKSAEFSLMVTHRPWEGPRKELSISANGQSASTGGRTVTNNANNWIQIANTQVGGVLATPVELQLTNNGGSAVGYRNFYLATNAYSAPASLTQELGSGSVTMSGSGSNYSGSINYALNAATMGYTQGRAFKFLARLTTQGGNVYCKPVIKDSTGVITLAEGAERYLPFSAFGTWFADVGSLPLPPGGYNTAWGATTLSFAFRGAGAYALTIASVKLMATDSYQYIVQKGNLVAAGDTITFDNIEQTFNQAGQSLYSVRNGRLMVFPGVTQRINILQDEGTSSDTAKTLSVRAFIRERRLTV